MNEYRFRLAVCLALALAGLGTPAWGQDSTPTEPAQPAADGAPAAPAGPPVAATVNGDPIFVASLVSKFQAIQRQRRISAQQIPQAMAELLTQLVRQRIVVQALEREQGLVNEDEIKRQLDQIESQVRKEKAQPLEQFVKENGYTVDDLRKEIIWQLGWSRYLERHIADALEGYFDKHKKDLDGTEVRVSHILLRPSVYSETNEQLVERAKQIRADVEAGKLTFEEAAAKYSAGPSRAKGGDLGFIPRYGVMANEFAEAAFELDKGQIGEPVTTTFGTHLIRVTDIKPGSRQWTEVIPQIKTLASADVFDALADREMKKSEIKYTGTTPYIDPETEKLVIPQAPQQPAAK